MNEYGYNNSELSQSSEYILPAVIGILRDLPPHALVVDVGCGNGSMLAQLIRPGLQLYGLEMSRSGLAESKKGLS